MTYDDLNARNLAVKDAQIDWVLTSPGAQKIDLRLAMEVRREARTAKLAGRDLDRAVVWPWVAELFVLRKRGRREARGVGSEPVVKFARTVLGG